MTRGHAGTPRPGHGTVGVLPWRGEETPDGPVFGATSWEDETGPLWHASWRDGDRRLDSPPGSRDDAIGWALTVPAVGRRVLDERTGGWSDL